MLTTLSDIRNRIDRWLVGLALRQSQTETRVARKHVSLYRWGPDEPVEARPATIAPPRPQPTDLAVLQEDAAPHSVAPRRLCLDSFPSDEAGPAEALTGAGPVETEHGLIERLVWTGPIPVDVIGPNGRTEFREAVWTVDMPPDEFAVASMQERLQRTIALEFRNVPDDSLTSHLAQMVGAAVYRLYVGETMLEIDGPLLWEPPDRVQALQAVGHEICVVSGRVLSLTAPPIPLDGANPGQASRQQELSRSS